MSSNIKAKIFKPSKSTMQYRAHTYQKWKLEFYPLNTQYIEPLMNWIGSKNPQQQISLYFPTLEQAIAYANQKNIAYTVVQENLYKKKTKSYANNFLK